jgi:nitric oxide dioxygenase
MLSAETIQIIKSTAPILATRGTEITTHFYKKMFAAHPELLNIFNHGNQRKGKQQAALANAVYAAAANIDNLESILPVVKQIAHKHRSLGVTADQYPIVGENLLAAIKDVLGDAATPAIMSAWEEAYGLLAKVFISVEQDMYDAAAGQPGGWRDFRRFKVQRKVTESDVISSFYLVPADGGPIADFQPGQYVSVKLIIPGEQYTHIRQYSLSDASGKGYYRLTIKREDALEDREEGVVSSFLHNSIAEGDELLLSAPAGEFVLEPKEDTQVVLLSGGVGITPMLSMLNSTVQAQPQRPVTFIHAAINSSHHAMRDEVEAVVAKSQNARAYFVYERPTDIDIKNQAFHHSGYINLEWLKKVVPSKDADFYFCGPLPFMKAMYRALKSWGVMPERMRYELFGPAESLEN